MNLQKAMIDNVLKAHDIRKLVYYTMSNIFLFMSNGILINSTFMFKDSLDEDGE